VGLYDYLFLGLLAAVTAVSIKIVGIILVPALLVVPAAAAKNISRSFRQMVWLSIVMGVASVVSGLIGSFYLNTAAGATVVLVSIALFGATFAFSRHQ
jgi:zinc transport system permease protein